MPAGCVEPLPQRAIAPLPPDVIVGGAGAAGLIAALAAARAGARVALFDRDDGTGSNLAVSGGLIAAAGTPWQADAGIADSAEIWLSDIARATKGGQDPTVARLVTTHASDALSLIAEAAGQTVRVIDDIVFPGHGAARLHDIGGHDGGALARALLQAVRAIPAIACHRAVPVDGLLAADGAVTGIRCAGDAVEAPATVLATGGFGADPAIVRAHMPELAEALYIGSAHNDGAGIGWARALGAPVRDMGGYQGHGHATRIGNGRLGAGVTSVGAILVDPGGRRFVNEDIGPSGLAGHVARCAGGAVEIFTEAMHRSFLRFASYDDAVRAGAVRRFDDVQALAQAFALPADALAETLADYNAVATGARPDPFGRQSFGGPLAPPLRAVSVTAALVHTQGGLGIDANAAVLGAEGTPIRGLYGAGGCVVGLTGNAPDGYLPGHGLAQSMTLGMLAGRSAAGC